MEAMNTWRADSQASYLIEIKVIESLRGKRTQKQLCEAAGYDQSSYTKLKKGELRHVSGEALNGFADTLSVPPVSLLDNSTPEYVEWIRSGQNQSPAHPFPSNSNLLTTTQESDVQRIREQINSGEQLISVIAPPGAGKTTVLHGLRRSYAPHEVCFLDFDVYSTSAEIWNSLRLQLYPDQESGELDRLALIDRLNRVCSALIIDLHPDQEQLRPLLEFLSIYKTIPIVIGTARPTHIAHESILNLTSYNSGVGSAAFSASDVWQIIQAPLEEARVQALEHDEQLVLIERIAEMCQGHIGAIRWLGERLRFEEPRDLLMEFQTLSLRQPHDVYQGIAHNRVKHFVKATTPEQQLLFRMLPKCFSIEEMDGANGLASSQVTSMLDAGMTAGLLSKDGDDYRVNRMLQVILNMESQLASFPSEELYRFIQQNILDGEREMPDQLSEVCGRYIRSLSLAMISDSCTQETFLKIVNSCHAAMFTAAFNEKITWPELLSFVQAVVLRLDRSYKDYYKIARYGATACIYMGDFSSAAYWVNECEQSASNSDMKGATLNLKGTLILCQDSVSRQDMKTALGIFTSGAELYAKKNNHISVATLLNNCVHCYELLGDLGSAVQTMNKREKSLTNTKESINKDTLMYEVLLNDCRIHARQHDWESTAKSLQKFSQLSERIGGRPTQIPHATFAAVSIALDQARAASDQSKPGRDGRLLPPSIETVKLAKAARLRSQLDLCMPQYLEESTLRWVEEHASTMIGGSDLDLRIESSAVALAQRIFMELPDTTKGDAELPQ